MGCSYFSAAVVDGGLVVLADSADNPSPVGGIAQELIALCNVPIVGGRTTHDTKSPVEKTGRRCDYSLRHRSRLDDPCWAKAYEETS